MPVVYFKGICVLYWISKNKDDCWHSALAKSSKTGTVGECVMTAISGENFVNMPQYLKCKDHWDLPPWSSDEDSVLPLHGAWVQFLVEELRSHMLHSPPPPPKKCKDPFFSSNSNFRNLYWGASKKIFRTDKLICEKDWKYSLAHSRHQCQPKKK